MGGFLLIKKIQSWGDRLVSVSFGYMGVVTGSHEGGCKVMRFVTECQVSRGWLRRLALARI